MWKLKRALLFDKTDLTIYLEDPPTQSDEQLVFHWSPDLEDRTEWLESIKLVVARRIAHLNAPDSKPEDVTNEFRP